MYCDKCESELDIKYSGIHDAYYCETCDIWLEQKCKDDDCEYCVDRPEKPSQIIN